MVRSQIVSITPAEHADAHRHGGTDPLTGDVRIDGLGYTYNGTEVVPTNLVGTTWTDIDLSAIVGAARTAVVMRVNNDAVAALVIAFRAKGDTDILYNATGHGSNQAYLEAGATQAAYAIGYTDTSGILQYYASGANVATIDLEMWANVK